MEKYKELFGYKKVSEHLVRTIRRTDNTAAKDIYLYDVCFYIDNSVYDCYIYAVNYEEALDIFLNAHPSLNMEDIFNIKQLG